MAFERINGPLGGRRADYHAALISASITNGIRALSGKRGSKRLNDFLIEWDKRRGPMSPRDMLREIRSINRALGGNER